MGKQWKQCQTLFWGAPKSLQMVTAAMKLKDATSWKKSYDQPAAAAAKLLQSCLTPSNPMDCSPPGPSVHGILQARTLEWVAISLSRGSSPPRDLNSCLLQLLHWGRGSLPSSHQLLT